MSKDSLFERANQVRTETVENYNSSERIGALLQDIINIIVSVGSENQTIAGTKSFMFSPIVPTPALPYHAANKIFVENAIANLVNSAPENLNTLKELADALNDDSNFANHVIAELARKINRDAIDLDFNDFSTNPIANKVVSLAIKAVYQTIKDTKNSVTGDSTKTIEELENLLEFKASLTNKGMLQNPLPASYITGKIQESQVEDGIKSVIVLNYMQNSADDGNPAHPQPGEKWYDSEKTAVIRVYEDEPGWVDTPIRTDVVYKFNNMLFSATGDEMIKIGGDGSPTPEAEKVFESSPKSGIKTTIHPRWAASKDDAVKGTDKFGFNALPGDFRSEDGSVYTDTHPEHRCETLRLGGQTKDESGQYVICFDISSNSPSTSNGYNDPKLGYSVRLVCNTLETEQHPDGTIIPNAYTDIDGNNYSGVIINGLIWLRENLKVKHYVNGDLIPIGLSATDWANDTLGAMHILSPIDELDTEEKVIATYGALYNWYTFANIVDTNSGWRVPTYHDFELLEMSAGGWAIAGDALKSRRQLDALEIIVPVKNKKIDTSCLYPLAKVAVTGDYNNLTNKPDYEPRFSNIESIKANNEHPAFKDEVTLAFMQDAQPANPAHNQLWYAPSSNKFNSYTTQPEGAWMEMEMSTTGLFVFDGKRYTWTGTKMVKLSEDFLKQFANPTIAAATNDHPRWDDSTDVNVYGTDELNFSAVPSGYIGMAGNFAEVLSSAYIWSSTAYNTGSKYCEFIDGYSNDVGVSYLLNDSGAPVRLVREATASELLLTNGSIITSAHTDKSGNIYDAVKIGNLLWLRKNYMSRIAFDGNTIQMVTAAEWQSINAVKCTLLSTISNITDNDKIAYYGLLYNYDAAVKLVGDNWRLPTSDEFTTLNTIAQSGAALKSYRQVNSPFVFVDNKHLAPVNNIKLRSEDIDGIYTDAMADRRVAAGITHKQDALISGANIKTINGVSILGAGDATISGLSNFTETAYTYTKAGVKFAVNNAATNVDVVLPNAKGTGAIMLQQPDGTATNGNARGDYAIDLQTSRSSGATYVASGNNSIAIGTNNKASGPRAIAIGNSASSTGNYSIGINGNASGQLSVGLSWGTAVTGNSFSFGSGSQSNNWGEFCHSGGTAEGYSAQNQMSEFIFYGKTTDATSKEIFLDGSSSRLSIPYQGIIDCDIVITAKYPGTFGASFKRRVVAIKAATAATAIMPICEAIGTDYKSDAGFAISIAADTTNGTLNITVTGIAGQTVVWTAAVRASLTIKM